MVVDSLGQLRSPWADVTGHLIVSTTMVVKME